MITPLDIQNKILKKEFRGYSITEVDEFLNTIIESYEQLYRQNIESRDKIISMQDTINHYKALEDTLKSTLVTAQQTGDSIQHVAKEKAKAITDEAYTTAKQLVSDAHNEVKTISQKYDEIKRSIDVYRARMTALINSQLDLLSSAASDKTLTELVGVNEALQELADNADTGSGSDAAYEQGIDEQPVDIDEQPADEDTTTYDVAVDETE
ncbi:MAG: DivIVA domain-containing protein [Clostridiaceae bacterium]|nr:DivIVA domain-containing protein [Clostridiaceae bacterium]